MPQIPGPPTAKLSEVKPGCYVKKCFKANRKVRKGPYKGQLVSRECMWIKVKKVTKDGFEGTLANSPIAVPMRHGQKVRVKRSEVVRATCRMP
jgi:hypothetical protein